MIIAILIVAGLCLGSFVNALVWRVHEQAKRAAKKLPGQDETHANARMSVIKGRSMCPDCRHELAAKDLVPVLSWLFLKGKCRYCGRPISMRYPLIELSTAGLFVASYVWWPHAFGTAQAVVFVLWLALLTGLMALLVYDLRWLTLPNRIIYPLCAVAVIQAIITSAIDSRPLAAAGNYILAVIIGGGVFYVIFQVSDGKWIGGGDVKLGWLLGLVVGTPAGSMLFIFFGSLLGSLASVPLLASGRLKRNSVIPFGPFLIAGAIITVLFGADVLHWYQRTFLNS